MQRSFFPIFPCHFAAGPAPALDENALPFSLDKVYVYVLEGKCIRRPHPESIERRGAPGMDEPWQELPAGCKAQALSAWSFPSSFQDCVPPNKAFRHTQGGWQHVPRLQAKRLFTATNNKETTINHLSIPMLFFSFAK